MFGDHLKLWELWEISRKSSGCKKWVRKRYSRLSELSQRSKPPIFILLSLAWVWHSLKLQTTAGNVPCSTGVDVFEYFAGGCEVTGVSRQRWKRSRTSLRFLIIIRDKPGVQPVHEARNDPFRTETLACVRHRRNFVLTNSLPSRSVSEKKLQNFTWTEAQLWNTIRILPALMVCWLNTFTSDYMTCSGIQSFNVLTSS